MSTLATQLAGELLQREYVAECFRDVHVQLVHHVVHTPRDGDARRKWEWSEVLTWSSVLVASDVSEHVELALGALVCCLLTEEGEGLRNAAVTLLTSTSNLPTVNLARSSFAIQLADVTSSPVLRLDLTRRRLAQSIFDEISGQIMPVTPFQRSAWSALSGIGDVAVSAPTSAGKSFILLRWLLGLAGSCESVGGDSPLFVYVVPSRALIRQVSTSLRALAREHSVDVSIATMPTLFNPTRKRPNILVMTQERIERLFAANPSVAARVLVVDEAQKLGEGPRGVILQRTVDEALLRNGRCRVVVAAPHASNPEVLLPRADLIGLTAGTSTVVESAAPTVTQNLLWVNRIPRRGGTWSIELIHRGNPVPIGRVALRPVTGKKKQLAALAVSFGRSCTGNIVFANGPGEAETIGRLIADGLRDHEPELRVHAEVMDLVRLIRTTVHPSYPVVTTLLAGVGIHYGDMPEIVRREQERLFDEGLLTFLVCTSTLLEGVNLPCRNLFVWGPRRGNARPMSMHSFWNLAGRAGRWGREFAGNIYCVQVHDPKSWPSGPPRMRASQHVSNAGQDVVENLGRFELFCASRNPSDAARENRYLEQIVAELVVASIRQIPLSSIPWLRDADAETTHRLELAIGRITGALTAPTSLILRHRGIHPSLICQLWDFLVGLPPESADEYLPMAPSMPRAEAVLADNLRLCDEFLGSEFGSQPQRNLKARITVQWIRGTPLGQMINERLKWLMENRRGVRAPAVIRSVIELINENARYAVPKYVSCYADCVREWCEQSGREDLASEIHEMQDLYEAGVAEQTTLALIALGLSRTAAVEVASHIPNSQLSITDVISWLKSRDLAAYNLSPVIIREIHAAFDAVDFL